MLHLSDKWGPVLVSQPESGMGYQIVSIYLRGGQRIDNVMIVGNIITEINGKPEITFTEDEIIDIRVMNTPRRH